jgi:hypothetical protein
MKDMQVKVNRDKLVKQKGEIPIPKKLHKIELNQKTETRMQELLLEAIALSTSKDPKVGPFSMEGEDDERIT